MIVPDCRLLPQPQAYRRYLVCGHASPIYRALYDSAIDRPSCAPGSYSAGRPENEVDGRRPRDVAGRYRSTGPNNAQHAAFEWKARFHRRERPPFEACSEASRRTQASGYYWYARLGAAVQRREPARFLSKGAARSMRAWLASDNSHKLHRHAPTVSLHEGRDVPVFT